MYALKSSSQKKSPDGGFRAALCGVAGLERLHMQFLAWPDVMLLLDKNQELSMVSLEL
jgi:hypothetical protein